MTDQNEKNDKIKETTERLSQFVDDLKNKYGSVAVDAVGDAVEKTLVNVDELLEKIQGTLRDLRDNVDEKTEPKDDTK